MQIPENPVYNFIYSILLGNAPAWPDNAPSDFTKQLTHKLYRDGLHPLIHHLYSNLAVWETWPSTIRAQIKKTAIHHSACQMAEEAATRDLIEALQNAGIYPIVLKGTAISYTHYPANNIRTRGDIDLLFDRKDLHVAFQILESIGYKYIHRQGYLGQELGFARINASAGDLPLDVHWRSSSYVLLAHILSYQEIRRSAVSIPQLAPLPCAMNTVHALLHACLHIVKHTASGDSIRVLWQYDLYLLCKYLSNQDKQQFVDLCMHKKVSSICYTALKDIAQKLPNDQLSQLLLELKGLEQHEPSARMLKHNAPSFLLADLASAGSGRALLQSIQDIVFPPASYMLRFYRKRSFLWLPLLYIHRFAHGLKRFLSK